MVEGNSSAGSAISARGRADRAEKEMQQPSFPFTRPLKSPWRFLLHLLGFSEVTAAITINAAPRQARRTRVLQQSVDADRSRAPATLPRQYETVPAAPAAHAPGLFTPHTSIPATSPSIVSTSRR